jgi:hypothetical protein
MKSEPKPTKIRVRHVDKAKGKPANVGHDTKALDSLRWLLKKPLSGPTEEGK